MKYGSTKENQEVVVVLALTCNGRQFDPSVPHLTFSSPSKKLGIAAVYHLYFQKMLFGPTHSMGLQKKSI